MELSNGKRDMRTVDRFDVLVIEDNAGDSFLAVEALADSREWAFDTRVVETLAEGLERFAERLPDVVMLDLQLPDAHRFEGLLRIREAAPDVPVVVVTGNDEPRLGEKAMQAGAEDYVRKADIDNGHVGRVLAFAVHRKRAAMAVRSVEERFRALLQGVNDVVALHRADGALQYASPSAARLLGLEEGEALDPVGIERRVHPDDRGRVAEAFKGWLGGNSDPVQFRLLAASGEWIHCESVGSNRIDDPAVRGVVVITRDITDRKRSEMELAYQAVHDSMTGLPNRTLFFDRLDHALSRRERTGSQVAVLFIDLDHFKVVNDSCGHKTGDEVLMSVARALTDAVRPGDTVARLGGDEFAVLCEDVEGPHAARLASERLLQAASGLQTILGRQVRVSLSIGVAVAISPDATAEALLRDADAALYRAKEKGRGCVEVFDDQLRAAADRRVELEQGLETAIANGEMAVHYQPQVEIRTGRLTGMEALLRWTHPVLGSIPPAEFIPIAEQTGLIGSIGTWVLEQACTQLAEWRRTQPDVPVEVAVNISGRQLSDPQLVVHLRRLVSRTSVDVGRLCLEITESVVMEDAAASVATLRALRALGVRLAIDDFGTGYSSLAYLKRFPVDLLKVDRAFIAGLGRDPEDSVIVASIAQLAASLGVEVMAEGVETDHQLHEVAALGCRYGQGYFWGRPMPVHELDAVFDAARSGRLMGEAGDDRPAEAVPDAPVEDVVSVLTHELRTPITIIRGFAETLATLLVSGRTEVLESAIEAISRQTHGMEAVLGSLSEMRSVDEGSLRLDVEAVDLGRFVGELAGALATTVPDHAIDVEDDLHDVVPVDRARLGQVVNNLVTNAVNWSPAGAPVLVRVEREDQTALIRVIDRGPGIPADRAGEIFRKFARLDPARRSTGLGLYLARSFARAHGGDVFYRRAETGGAEFVVVLPLTGAATLPGSQARPSTPGPVRTTNVEQARTARSEAEAVAALCAATRALLHVSLPEHVVALGIDLVRDLGGRVVVGSPSPDDNVLLVDLSFGIGPSVLATALSPSLTRLRLEELLPVFADDARHVLAATAFDGEDARVRRLDPVTGWGGREPVLQALAGQAGATLLVALAPRASRDPDTALLVTRSLQDIARPGDVRGQWSPRVPALFRPGGEGLDDVAAQLEERWRRAGGPALGVGVAVTPVGGDVNALLEAERAARRAAGRDEAPPLVASVGKAATKPPPPPNFPAAGVAEGRTGSPRPGPS